VLPMYAMALARLAREVSSRFRSLHTERDCCMRWRLLRWVAVIFATAAAAGLAVEIAVAGTEQAAALAGVIVGFCELAALLLGVTAWVGERQTSAKAQQAKGTPSAGNISSGSKTPVADKRGQDGKYVVDARGATGLQVGENNTQNIISRPPAPGS